MTRCLSHRPSRLLLPLSLAAVLHGCAVGPDYQRPAVETPAAFKEAGSWKSAEPSDTLSRGNWWEIYQDPVLSGLVSQVEVSNQNVQLALAQYRQALALLGVAQAAAVPSVSAGLSGVRANTTTSSSASAVSNSGPIITAVKLPINASWEPDLWGGISRSIEANRASASASATDLSGALLSAQATLVQTYFQLRANDAQQKNLTDAVTAYEKSLEITRNRYEEGVAQQVDVAQALTQLEATRAQLIDLQVQRAQYEHAIAVLIGKPPAELSIQPTGELPSLPETPQVLPSALLERRPDIASAERRMAQTNAQIGVAQAAFFPTLNLTATAGQQNTSLSNLFSLPSRYWAVGPTFSLPLFNGGLLSSQKQSAQAAYEASVASYRQTVLAAFQDVEDNLAALHLLEREVRTQQLAAHAADQAMQLTFNQYEEGTVSYLNVVTTQATALTTQNTLRGLQGRQLVAHALLLKALGGTAKTP